MRAVEFLYRNSADPNLMRMAICPSCEHREECEKTDDMNFISPLSMYIIRYLTEIRTGFNYYPYPGTWEDQPEWFMACLDIGRAAFASAERREYEDTQTHKRNIR